MANVLTLDCETLTSNKGNPFDLTNKLVCVGLKWNHLSDEHIQCVYEGGFDVIQYEIDRADLLVGFNIKFDLHWLRQIGIDISRVKVWDCQIGEFLLENQTNPYPSLDQAAEKYGFDKKLDIVKTEYWNKGIDTDCIPREVLSEYLAQDLTLTEQVFLEQHRQFKEEAKDKYTLFKLLCMDLLVLEEMEYNGIKFNTKEARQYATQIDIEQQEIYQKLVELIGNIPFNLNSNDHVSAILYGGFICIDDRIPVGVYKSGAKVGHTRYKIVTKKYDLPRLVEPLKGTETKEKEGEDTKYWLVNNTVLRTLKLSKRAKELVQLIQQYGELDKLKNTYLLGYSDLITKMNWEEDTLHGTLNQCTVVTGRLSSTRPNLQNSDPITKTFMRSKYVN